MKNLSWSNRALLLLMVATAGAVSAQVVDDPCKNHYILGVGGMPRTDTKCQSAVPPDVIQPPTQEAPTLRITQIYSSMDGSTQFVELTEYAGRDGQDHVAGLTLTSTSRGITKTLVFPQDLPSSKTAYASFVVGVAHDPDGVTSAQLHSFSGCCTTYRDVDFEMPPRFLSVEGGTLAFGGDTWNYPPLPPGGAMALYRDGSIGIPRLGRCPDPSNPLCTIRFSLTTPLVGAVEFRNVFNDQRYVTASADAIETIDGGFSPGWVRTGLELNVAEVETTYLGVEWTFIGSPVCRYRVPSQGGVGYFYSLAPAECAAAGREPGAVLEAAEAFYAQYPNSLSASCAVLVDSDDVEVELTPVYRLSSPGSAWDTRLTTDPADRDALVAAGWKKSGFGPDGIAFCIW